MHPVHDQKEANKFLEGGVFYPTGHIVVAFENAAAAKKAQVVLTRGQWPEGHVLYVDAASMADEAEENLQDASFLSAGASVPARQKQLELAKAGCHFLLIFAPDTDDQERAMSLLNGHAVVYAAKYNRLIIENLVQDIYSSADKEAARSP
jgi:hypothetical protein